MVGRILGTGLFGLLALLSAAGIGVLVIYAWFGAKKRSSFLLLTVAAGVPLVFGGVGAFFGHRQVDAVLSSTPGTASPREEAEGRRQANSTLWLGGGLSVALAVCAGLGLAFKRADSETLL
ncbi:MAG: hypothetical protein GY711_05075 [bacterium]|nr:hypothetical protein [bacterium]